MEEGTHRGEVHLVAGSLIRAGSPLPRWGYVVGREDLVARVETNCTGTGSVWVLVMGSILLYQGLWLAPHMVEALCGAILIGAYFSKLGFEVHPGVDAPGVMWCRWWSVGIRSCKDSSVRRCRRLERWTIICPGAFGTAMMIR